MMIRYIKDSIKARNALEDLKYPYEVNNGELFLVMTDDQYFRLLKLLKD